MVQLPFHGDKRILTAGVILLVSLIPVTVVIRNWASTPGQIAVLGVEAAVALGALAYRRIGMKILHQSHMREMVMRALHRGIE